MHRISRISRIHHEHIPTTQVCTYTNEYRLKGFEILLLTVSASP